MLNRRKFITNSVKSAATLSLLGVADRSFISESHANILQLGDVRAPNSLGVTMGSITGAALKIIVYAALTRQVPSSVIVAFAGILGANALSRNLSSATRTYIDYRMDEAEEKILVANGNIREAMARDTVDFTRLSSIVVSQGNQLQKLRNSSETVLREFREFKSELKDQISVFTEEENRSGTSATIHQFAKDKLRTGSSAEDAATKKACDQVSHAAGELKKYIQSLQRSTY